jgi:hypothetical protein
LDAKSIRLALENDGFVVVRSAVPAQMCRAVLAAIRDDQGISVDDPATWDRVSSGIDQVPLWGHQSQWDIRQLPEIHELWSMIWGTHRLWTTMDSCRFTPPAREGRAGPLPLHWDVDPRDRDQLWYQGVLALTPARAGGGGFRCAPALMHNRDRWPQTWTTTEHGTEYHPDLVKEEDVVEVAVDAGDLIVFSSRLPHGTVRNVSEQPRAAFYLHLFPAGTPEQAATRVCEYGRGIAPEWWRWKPGHDRAEPWPPARLSALGRRLLGLDPWP